MRQQAASSSWFPLVYRKEHGMPKLRRHQGTGPDLQAVLERQSGQIVARIEQEIFLWRHETGQ
jgi:hypothetical protein